MRAPIPTHRWPVVLLLGILSLSVVAPAAATTHTNQTHSSSTGEPSQDHPALSASVSKQSPFNLQVSTHHVQERQIPTKQATVVLNKTGPVRLNATYHIPIPNGQFHAVVDVNAFSIPYRNELSPTIDWVKNGRVNKSKGEFNWDGSGRFAFKLTYHLPKPRSLNQQTAATPRGTYIDPLAFRVTVPYVPHHYSWYYRLNTHLKTPNTHLYHFGTQESGGTRVVYIGHASVKNVTMGNETITLFLPQTAATTMQSTQHPPSQVLSAYRTESKLLSIGVKPSHIYVLVYPSKNLNLTGETGLTRGDIIHIWSTDPIHFPYTPWLHEYVHTRQYSTHNSTPGAGPHMQWYQEADANYYASLVSYNDNLTTFPALFTAQNSRDRPYSGTLSNKSSWGNLSSWRTLNIEYGRGPVVLGYFDTQIRRQTHGNASFLDVMRTINTQEEHGNQLTLVRFKHDLEKYLTNKTVNQGVSRYITGNQTIPISTRPTAYTLPPTAINTSSPAPPTAMTRAQYEQWKQAQRKPSKASTNGSSQPSTTSSVRSTSSTTTGNNTHSTAAAPQSTSSSSPGFGIGIAMTGLVMAIAITILRIRSTS